MKKNKRKRLPALLLAVVMLAALLPVGALAYDDTESHWAKEAIDTWSANKVLSGYGDGTFMPDKPVTRAELAKILDVVMGYEKAGGNSFSDIKPTDWFYEHILKLAEAGVIKGYANGTARPNANVTRQEAAVMIARAFAVEENAGNEAPFADAEQLAAWAELLVNGMKAKGYIQGSQNQFRPEDNITRAEVVTIIDNMIGLYVNSDTPVDGEGSQTGNVLINTAGAQLTDMTVAGDLYVTEGVGDGNVKLDKLTVKGRTIIRGGGPNSVTLTDCTLESVEILQDGVRVVLSGETEARFIQNDDGVVIIGDGCTVESITVGQGATLTVEDGGTVDKATVEGGTVTLEKGAVAGEITLAGGEIALAEGAKATTVTVVQAATIKNDGTITALTADAGVEVTGSGTIDKATVNHDDVSFENEPKEIVVGQDIEKPEVENPKPTESGDDDYTPPPPYVSLLEAITPQVDGKGPEADEAKTNIGKYTVAMTGSGNVYNAVATVAADKTLATFNSFSDKQAYWVGYIFKTAYDVTTLEYNYPNVAGQANTWMALTQADVDGDLLGAFAEGSKPENPNNYFVYWVDGANVGDFATFRLRRAGDAGSAITVNFSVVQPKTVTEAGYYYSKSAKGFFKANGTMSPNFEDIALVAANSTLVAPYYTGAPSYEKVSGVADGAITAVISHEGTPAAIASAGYTKSNGMLTLPVDAAADLYGVALSFTDTELGIAADKSVSASTFKHLRFSGGTVSRPETYCLTGVFPGDPAQNTWVCFGDTGKTPYAQGSITAPRQGWYFAGSDAVDPRPEEVKDRLVVYADSDMAVETTWLFRLTDGTVKLLTVKTTEPSEP